MFAVQWKVSSEIEEGLTYGVLGTKLRLHKIRLAGNYMKWLTDFYLSGIEGL
jgi:hypothetical protein